MDNLQKAEILCEFISLNFDDETYNDFFYYNDVGVPMAVALKGGLVNLTDEGEKVFNETWIEFCNIFGADPEYQYEDFEDLIDE